MRRYKAMRCRVQRIKQGSKCRRQRTCPITWRATNDLLRPGCQYACAPLAWPFCAILVWNTLATINGWKAGCRAEQRTHPLLLHPAGHTGSYLSSLSRLFSLQVAEPLPLLPRLFAGGDHVFRTRATISRDCGDTFRHVRCYLWFDIHRGSDWGSDSWLDGGRR